MSGRTIVAEHDLPETFRLADLRAKQVEESTACELNANSCKQLDEVRARIRQG